MGEICVSRTIDFQSVIFKFIDLYAWGMNSLDQFIMRFNKVLIIGEIF